MFYLFLFFKTLFYHRKINRVISTAIREEKLLLAISTLLGTQVDIDWVGRIYGVINPEVENGEYKPGRITDLNGSTKAWVDNFIVSRFSLLRDFISEKNLFDLVTYHIKALRDNNFLIVVEPITYSELMRALKRMVIELLVELTVIGIFCYILM